MLVFVSVQNEHFHTILHNQFLPPANEVCKGYVFTPVCQSFCSHGGEYLGRYTPGQVHPSGRYTPMAGTPPLAMYAGIWSTSGRYASYWNAFLFIGLFTGLDVRQCEHTITIHPLYQSIYWILKALKFGWSFQRRCKLWFWWVKLNITYGILFIQKLHPWENN